MKSFLKGRINNGLTDVDCVIRDLSVKGAMLSCSGGITMPGVIDLHIPLKKKTMRAKVDWRRGDEIGVSFIDDLPLLPEVDKDTHLTERVAKLEAEIESLGKMLVQLRRKVFPHEGLLEAG